MSSERERGVRNVVDVVAGQLAAQAVLVVSAFVIPRVLGPESFGRYAALMAMIAILQTASTCGLPLVEVRDLAPMWQLGEVTKARRLAATIWITRLVLSLVCGLLAVVWLVLSPELEAGVWLCVYLGTTAFLRYAFESTSSLFLPFGHAGKLSVFHLLRACLTLAVVVAIYPTFQLTGVLAGLSLMNLGLSVASWAALGSHVRLRPSHFSLAALRPYRRFSLETYVGQLAWMIQGQFSIYAAASWATRQEAGFLGFTLQIYSFLQLIFLAARRALTPILAELEARGETERIRYWGGLMMRYAAAASCMTAVGWALAGKDLVRVFLTDAFAPVYPSVTVVLIGVALYFCAETCNGILYVRGFARLASGCTIVYALATIAGVFLALRGEPAGASYRIAIVYAAASVVFIACSYSTLAAVGGMWLPLRRALLLILPAGLSWTAMYWDAPPGLRWAAAALFAPCYLWLAIQWGLLPGGEMRQLIDSVKDSYRTRPRP